MTVTVFTNPSNPQCKATEQELSKLGVRYVAVDLTQNPSTFEQIKDAGFKQIPVVISPNSSWSLSIAVFTASLVFPGIRIAM